MILTILMTILALAVVVLAALVCAMRKRMATVEAVFNTTLKTHNRRLWEMYILLRWHVRLNSHVHVGGEKLKDIDGVFNLEER